jgi:hypothetical protein
MTPVKIGINGYIVKISYDYIFEHLQKDWLSIQRDRSLPFFLTWTWISCWIKTYMPKIIVVRACWQGEVVAIGLLTQSIERRNGFIRSRQYRLHQVGDQSHDQIWIEYNDFITIDEHTNASINACLLALQTTLDKWDEILISMITASRAKKIQADIRNGHIISRIPTYVTEFENIANGGDYVSSLKSNTRYQINRSIRLYEERYGKLGLNSASTTEEALYLFHAAGKFHIKRWVDSGYKNPDFIQFHENLIKKSFNNNEIDIINITSGTTIIGILYFHLVNKDVFFYLQGLRYEEDNKLKPGLVSHALTTQYYLDKGMRRYDYMGGESQYKCQLASESDELVTLCIKRPQLQFAVENAARYIKKFTKRIVMGQV